MRSRLGPRRRILPVAVPINPNQGEIDEAKLQLQRGVEEQEWQPTPSLVPHREPRASFQTGHYFCDASLGVCWPGEEKYARGDWKEWRRCQDACRKGGLETRSIHSSAQRKWMD